MNVDLPLVARCWSRILIPFQLSSGNVGSSRHVAEAFRQWGGDWDWQGPSEVTSLESATGGRVAHSRYMVEYLEPVAQFLFAGAGRSGCHYLRANGDPIGLRDGSRNIWMGAGLRSTTQLDQSLNRPSARGLQVLADEQLKWEGPSTASAPNDSLRLGPLPDWYGVEVWFSRLGVGVLSVPLLMEPCDGKNSLDVSSLVNLHHALATGQKRVWLGPRPTLEGTTPTASTHFHEAVHQLLAPLRRLGHLRCHPRGMAYVALQVMARGDIGETAAVLPWLADLLAQLAQLQPSNHPGGAAIPNLLRINHEHLSVLDLCGAAHAAIVYPTYAEPSQRVYAEQRADRCQVEYFPSYLLAVLQRLCLHELLERSTRLVSGVQAPKPETIREFHRLALAYRLEGELQQVSWRSSVQQFHDQARLVCDVEPSLNRVRDTLESFDRNTRAEMEEERARETLRAERNLQVLEVFLVSVYAVAVAHYLAEAFEFHHGWLTGASLIVVLVLTIVVVIWQATRDERSDLPERSPRFLTWRGWPLIGALLLIHAAFLTFNAWLHLVLHGI